MDCEKFETAMMDELYGELDEVTSAAAARHVAGCARCAGLIGGLRATRRVATIPMVDPPANLEPRILKATAQVHTTVPLRRRVARSVSIAGDWAMRPQTAMAAVFMVMLGTSLLLLRGKSSRAPASAEMRVTEQGTPAPAGSVAVLSPQSRPPEPMAAAPVVAARRPAEPKAAMTPSPAAPPADMALDERRRTSAFAQAPGRDDEGVASDQKGGPAGLAAAPSPLANGGAGAAVSRGYGGPPMAEQAALSPFDSALKLYQSARYDAAAHAFDAISASDPTADLWSARAIREGKGCRSAVARFDKVAQRAAGSSPGWDSLLEGALCYRSIGDFGNARVRLNALLSVDSHKDRARAELDRLSQMQSQGGGFTAPAAKAAPRSAPAAAAPATQSQ
jgi:hypothetical protein